MHDTSDEQHPLLNIIGAWADMGDATLDAFDEEITLSRSMLGRDVELPYDEEKQLLGSE
jgi:hypothetical protein